MVALSQDTAILTMSSAILMQTCIIPQIGYNPESDEKKQKSKNNHMWATGSNICYATGKHFRTICKRPLWSCERLATRSRTSARGWKRLQAHFMWSLSTRLFCVVRTEGHGAQTKAWAPCKLRATWSSWGSQRRPGRGTWKLMTF